ncbi:MAG: zinc ribbon domain-containing protein [Thermodesulfobacteriota bacterium]
MIDFKKCPSCGQQVSPAATYCSYCGKSLEEETGWSGLLFKAVLVALIAALIYGLFFAGVDEWRKNVAPEAADAIAKLRQAVSSLADEYLSDKPQSEAPPAKPEATASVPAPQPSPPPTGPGPSAKPRAVVGGKYTTRSGHLASLRKDWFLEARRFSAANDQEKINKMVAAKQVVKLKADLPVVLQETGEKGDWVKLKIEGKDTVFYTSPAAIGLNP